MINKERRDEETPAGGDYSEVYYMDLNDNPVDKANAKKIIIRELKQDGTLIQETFMYKENNR